MEEKIAYKPTNIELKPTGEFIINDEGIKELENDVATYIDNETFERMLIDLFSELIFLVNAETKDTSAISSKISLINTYLPIYQKKLNLPDKEIENERIKAYGGLYMLINSIKENMEKEKEDK